MALDHGTSMQICKYCGQVLRAIEPVVLIQGDSDTPPIRKTQACDSCGASTIDRKSPVNGDCVLEMPSEFKYALEAFSERVCLLGDSDDPHNPNWLVSPLECSLADTGDDYLDETNHAQHGDSLKLSVCDCSTLYLHFDGYSVERILQDVDFLGAETIGHFDGNLDSFNGLRYKLDELLFESSQIRDVAMAMVQTIAMLEHLDWCTGPARFRRLEAWGLGIGLSYSERLALFRSVKPEPGSA